MTESDTPRSIEVGGSKLDILGTAHVSSVSHQTVTELIGSKVYDSVAVELCAQRVRMIFDEGKYSETDVWQLIKKKQMAAFATGLLFSAFQQRIAEQIGVEPGSELKAAVRLSREQSITPLLVDRDIGITFKRLYRGLSFWTRLSVPSLVFFSLFSRQKVSAEEIEALKKGDVLGSLFEQLELKHKDIYQTLVKERDRYMAAKVVEYIRAHKPSRVLLVVGAGHVNGLLREIPAVGAEPQTALKNLEVIPQPAKWPKYVPWVIVAVILSGFAIGFSRDTELGFSLVRDWVLINGGLAAIGAFIAGAHPLTVVTAFVAAPLTSINPTIGAGMVTAAAELYLRKPLVSDFKSLRKCTSSLAGWRKNRVARTALIFLLSTLGSIAGTWIGGLWIYESLS